MLRTLITSVLIASLHPVALGQDPGSVPLERVDLLSFEALDLTALAKEDARREEQGQPWRFAVPRDVSVSIEERGTWEVLPDGALLWRLRVGAPDAHSLNVGFTEFELAEGASLMLRTADSTSRIRPFTSADNQPHGELWTPVLISDEIVIELIVGPGQLDDTRLRLGRVGQGYRGFGFKGPDGSGADSGSCNLDVVCPEGDPWFLEIPAVGALQIGGSLNCTGVMLNDALDSLTPFLLTADHCGVSTGSATSLVVYWNYENSWCRPPFSSASGGSGDGTFNEFSTGSTHRADYGNSDFTLVEMNSDPNPAWDISYAGWSRALTATSGAIAIHHPQVQEKRISFEFDPTSITSYLGTSIPGDGTHVRVTDWDLGTTEPGSSGSPLFDPDHRVIGQLHGGYASCTSQTSDWYGSFGVSWTGGGSPSSRLKDWLDPNNTGVIAVDSISLATLCSDAGTAEITSGAACEGSVSVEVVDCGLDLDSSLIETISVTVTSGSEPAGEPVLLTETTPQSARFEGSLTLSQTDASGVLLVGPGDTVTLTYVDADDGMGGTGVVVTDAETVDCIAPTIANMSITGITWTTATVNILTSEPVSAEVSYGLSCSNLSESEDAPLATELSTSVNLSGLLNGTTYYFEVKVTDAAGNVTIDDSGGACFNFNTIPATDYFTEEFLSDFDMGNQSVTFTPDTGPDRYVACVEAITTLPVSPVGGTAISLSDDDSQVVNVTGSNTVSLYGTPYTQVHIGSNGYVTFGQGDTEYSESLSEHFSLPRVSGMFDDLNPADGGSVSYRQTIESLAITWRNIPEFSTGGSNTFQIELFFDGRVRISWLNMTSSDGIAGLSEGNGVQPDFLEMNLGGLPVCNDQVCQTDLGFGGPGSAVLTMCGEDLSTGTSADMALAGAAPNAPAVLVVAFSSNPTSLLGGTLVPFPPVVVIPLTTNSAGALILPGIAGGGGPLAAYAQFVIVDFTQPQFFALSNALEVNFLP